MEGGGWEEVQMERDNGGEPCFFGREPRVRHKAGGRFLDEVSALPSVTTRSIFPPSASARSVEPHRCLPPFVPTDSSVLLCYFPSDSSSLCLEIFYIFPAVDKSHEKPRSERQSVSQHFPTFLLRLWHKRHQNTSSPKSSGSPRVELQ